MGAYLIPKMSQTSQFTHLNGPITHLNGPIKRSNAVEAEDPCYKLQCSSKDRCWKDTPGHIILHHYTCDGTDARFSVPNVPTSNPTGVEAVSLQLATQFMWCMGDLARLCQSRNQLHLLLISTSPSWAPELKENRERQRNSSQILFAIAHGMKLVKVFKGTTLQWNLFRDNQGETYAEWLEKQWAQGQNQGLGQGQGQGLGQGQEQGLGQGQGQGQGQSQGLGQGQEQDQSQNQGQEQTLGQGQTPIITTDGANEGRRVTNGIHRGRCARCGDEEHGNWKCDWGHDGQAADSVGNSGISQTIDESGDGLDDEEPDFISSTGMNGEDALCGSVKDWEIWHAEFTKWYDENTKWYEERKTTLEQAP